MSARKKKVAASTRADVAEAKGLLAEIPPLDDDERWHAQEASNFVPYYAFLSAFAVRMPLGLHAGPMSVALWRLGDRLAFVRRGGVTS